MCRVDSKDIFFCEDCMMRRVRDRVRDSFECGWTEMPLHWFDRACNHFFPYMEPVTKPLPDDDDMVITRYLRCARCAYNHNQAQIGKKVIPVKGKCLLCHNGSQFKLKR